MRLRIDAHVHIHPCFDPFRALSCLMSNLCRDGAIGVALLTEREGERLLESWLRDSPPGRFASAPCSRGRCLCVHGPEEEELLLLPGRQLVTSDGLEVLALCMDSAPPKTRMPISDTLDWATQANALTVIPWGLGKWMGTRGRRVQSLLEKSDSGRFMLGDSTMRPSPCPGAGLLALARQQGFCVLPGSDALPVPGEEPLGGSFCAQIDYPGKLDDPLPQLRSLLSDHPSLDVVGQRASWWHVLRRQLAYMRSSREKR